MAPQGEIPIAANVLGTIGTVLWSIQLIPQIWFNWRLKKTDGLPALMMMLWALAAVPFGVYSVVQRFAIPIQMQPQIFGCLSLVTWGQIMHYYHGWKAWTATIVSGVLIVVFAGVEVLLVLTLRGPYSRGIEWPMLVVGILATVLLTFGLLPPYPEMWKRKGRVVGINFIFLAIDFFGAIFSLFALVAQKVFDPLGSSLYIVCIFLEGGIFISHFIWLLRTRELRRLAKAQGKSFDDLPEATPFHPPIVRHGSIAASRDLEEGECNTFSRRASLAVVYPEEAEKQGSLTSGSGETLGGVAKRASRSSLVASVRSKKSCATITEHQEEEKDVPPVPKSPLTPLSPVFPVPAVWKGRISEEERERMASLSEGVRGQPEVFSTPRMTPVREVIGGADMTDAKKLEEANEKASAEAQREEKPPPSRGESMFRELRWKKDEES